MEMTKRGLYGSMWRVQMIREAFLEKVQKSVGKKEKRTFEAGRTTCARGVFLENAFGGRRGKRGVIMRLEENHGKKFEFYGEGNGRVF